MKFEFSESLWQTLLHAAGFEESSAVGIKSTSVTTGITTSAASIKLPYREVAAAIQKQSDFYIEKPDGQTPWTEKWCQWAQLLYYFPLNYLRSQRVIQQAKAQDFFSGLNEIWEFGAGISPTLLALRSAGLTQKAFLVESSRAAQALNEKIHRDSGGSWQKSFEPTRNSLAVFSYSLTELELFPKAALNAEALMIIEPSTHQDGRRLLELRKKLIEEGYSIWAPCVHQLSCPLKEESQKDWCHDRIHIDLPNEFRQIESHLPFKNKTITMSYLLARKTPPKSNKQKLARVVGDFLSEKGKVRQLICKGPEREFLTCLLRNNAQPIELSRGDLIEISDETALQKIGNNELRYSNPSAVKVLTDENK